MHAATTAVDLVLPVVVVSLGVGLLAFAVPVSDRRLVRSSSSRSGPPDGEKAPYTNPSPPMLTAATLPRIGTTFKITVTQGGGWNQGLRLLDAGAMGRGV